MTVWELVSAFDRPEELRPLYQEYEQMLLAADPSFGKSLDQQNYDDEIAHLEDKYGQPAGRLYLALWDGAVAGCIGLRKIDEENCEMKRLYVRPKFRGKRIADALVQQIIADARTIGYRHMLLDTLPFLQGAIHMYQRCGFYEIESYNDSPMDTSIYMKLDL